MRGGESTVHTNKKEARRFRCDLLLVASLLLLSALGFLYLFLFRGSGDTVTVTIDGAFYGRYALAEAVTVDIFSGADGECLNRLVISDGKAYVEHASCPDGICVSHRPIFRDGESIICLPHGVVITVTVYGADDAPDIVA